MWGLLAGASAGIAVCLFGMWAFLKGQATMLDIRQGMRPRLLERTVRGDGGTDDLSRQVRALFAQPDDFSHVKKKGE